MATFLFAVAIVFIVDLPMWVKLAVLTWTAVPALVHEYQLRKRSAAAAERANHSSNALPDQMLHAYKESS
ncbi:hypothetical protein CVS30_10845 [Arthrobacter psychrolactophilus]|uniref:Uncharacterized protein n=1 Tax=Arthrobacter psychrolactophilus TaxID=92442 RepID=A0A2V5ISP6_9MICC|nr:hypothetical protein CVS30_10845 [Arthrobacter psychrolactophilus]